MNLLYSFPLSCMESTSCKASTFFTFLRKLTVLFLVVVIDKKADTASVTNVTLFHFTALQQGCRKLETKHGPSANSLFQFPANVLKFLVKKSYANTFLASGSEYNTPLPLERTSENELKYNVLFRQNFFKTSTR